MGGRRKLSDPLASVLGMDLNAFWVLVERSVAETSGQDRRLEWRLEWLAAVLPSSQAAEAFGGDLESELAARGLRVLVSPEPAGERWDFAEPVEISARVPRLGALFGKVA